MSAGFRAALIALLVLAPLAGGAAALPADSSSPSQVTPPAGNATTTIVVELQSDGDARWTVTRWFNLSTDAETDAFRELAADFTSGDADALGLPAYREASTRASDATNRDMEITAVQRGTAADSMIADGIGRVSVSFTWTNFARVGDERLHMGDVFETPGGTWLPGLEPGQSFVVTAPQGYSVFDATVPPENGTLRWTGPATFQPETLEATFSGTPNATETPGNGTDPGTGDGDDDDILGAVLWLLVAVTGFGIVVFYLTARTEDGFELPPVPILAGDSETEPDRDADEIAPESAAAPEAESDETAVEAETDEEEVDEEDDEIDLELLSNEERVEHLLEENGGRMKQATIVKETGWSNAKVSQLLSSMEADERIDKLRIGRENLISFPDEDVTDFED